MLRFNMQQQYKTASKLLNLNTSHVKVQRLIKTITLPNGRYDYNKDSVYKIFNKGVDRKTYLYARVSTPKQKNDLENQINLLKQFCFANGYQINRIFQDVASGVSFEKRKDFFKMLDDVIEGKVERIIITYKDRLSRVGFDLFYHLFKKYKKRYSPYATVASLYLWAISHGACDGLVDNAPVKKKGK